MQNTFYHAHVAGFTRHFYTIKDVQAWIDGIRSQVAGETLKVWRVVDCVFAKDPCICGPVSK